MFLDFFKSRLRPGFFDGACDMHSHILPGVDDGIQDVGRATRALLLLNRIGYKKVKLTPHFMKDYPENTRANIEARFQAFLTEVGDETPVELSLGGEYMLDSCFMDRCEEGFLTLDKNNTLVLCETSYMSADPQAPNMLYQAMLKGYQPVIAHPERYNYASMATYRRWKEKDYLLQLNLLSLAGAYGETAKSKARALLKEGTYDYVGSDLHRDKDLRDIIYSIRLSNKERDQLQRLLENNKEL
jgi:tyrosine-protein phosphatase YwqE